MARLDPRCGGHNKATGAGQTQRSTVGPATCNHTVDSNELRVCRAAQKSFRRAFVESNHTPSNPARYARLTGSALARSTRNVYNSISILSGPYIYAQISIPYVTDEGQDYQDKRLLASSLVLQGQLKANVTHYYS